MIPKNLLPAGYRACIAGGYAVCPALAGDMDVWVFIKDASKAEKCRGEIIVHLAEHEFEFATEREKRGESSPGPGGVNTIDFEKYPDTIVTCRVARVQVEGGLTAQIMVTTAKDEDELVNTFDVSTSQVAIRQDGAVIRGKNWTAVNVPPIVIANYPATPERLDRYTTRFQPSAAWADVIPF